MDITPTRGRVLVEIKTSENKSKGGVLLPEISSKDHPNEGVVLAVGQGRLDKKGKTITPQIKKGDKVIYSEYAGTEFEIEGRKHLILKEEDILAIK